MGTLAATLTDWTPGSARTRSSISRKNCSVRGLVKADGARFHGEVEDIVRIKAEISVFSVLAAANKQAGDHQQHQ